MSNTVDYDPNFKHQKVLCVVGTKALLLNTAGEILLLLRSQKVGQGGKWGLPGGGLEMNEQPLECMAREIEEETQLVIEDLQLFATRSMINQDEDYTVIIGYLGTVPADAKIVINWEHDSYEWFSQAAALQLPNLTQTTRLFLEQYSPTLLKR